MPGSRFRQGALASLVIAAAVGLLMLLPPMERLRGLSIDTLTWLRWSMLGPLHDPARSPTAVVVLDEETYRTAPFSGTPSITWTREIARVLLAVAGGGAKVIGLDVIFPTSLEQSQIPLSDSTLGERLRGFDRDFLRALALLARERRIVLGQVQHLERPIVPFEAQRFAVRDPDNIRPLNVQEDIDGIVRRIPLSFASVAGRVPSMSVELAARASSTRPVFAADGRAAGPIAGTSRPGIGPLVLNFEGGADDIPTFSFADLAACARDDDKEFFARHFAGRVVLLGVLLDLEDRSVTSKRFITGVDGARAPRCRLPQEPARNLYARSSIAGVYVHATAVNNLIRGDGLSEPPAAVRAVAGGAAGLLACAAALAFNPLPALLVVVAGALTWTIAAVWAIAQAQVLPYLDMIAAALIALAAGISYRLVIADSDKRLLRSTFSLYLAPALVERMLTSNVLPQLGGETREVTVYFSDLRRFSTIAEDMAPAEVVALMNTYLSAMTDIIEAHGGYVDKYIGDAIVAVFGAPLEDADHAASAVAAALAGEARLDALRRAAATEAGRSLHQRIGIATGEALVGNIGSHRRFNYTAMGDAVNLAARLEGANKQYDTAILVAASTAQRAAGRFLWREIDTVRVVGRNAPVVVLEPLAESVGADGRRAELARTYAKALASWRSGAFAEAAAVLEPVADSDPPSARLRERAQKLIADPPGEGWSPVNVLESK